MQFSISQYLISVQQNICQPDKQLYCFKGNLCIWKKKKDITESEIKNKSNWDIELDRRHKLYMPWTFR